MVFININYRCDPCFFLARVFAAGRHPNASYPSSGNAHPSPSSSWKGFSIFQYGEMLNICHKRNRSIFALFCLLFYLSFLSKDKISCKLLAEGLYA